MQISVRVSALIQSLCRCRSLQCRSFPWRIYSWCYIVFFFSTGERLCERKDYAKRRQRSSTFWNLGWRMCELLFALTRQHIIHTSRSNSTLTKRSLVLNVSGLWGLSLGLREHFSPLWGDWKDTSAPSVFKNMYKTLLLCHLTSKSQSAAPWLPVVLNLPLTSMRGGSLTLFIKATDVINTSFPCRLCQVSESSSLPVCVIPETCQNQTLASSCLPWPRTLKESLSHDSDR